MIYKFNFFEEKIIIPLFPSYKAKKANQKLFEDIKLLSQQEKLDANGSYMGNYTSLSVRDAKEFLEKTLEKKKSLEDKAKTNVFGVTIAVTLVTGLYKVFMDLNSMDHPVFYKIILFVIALYLLIQMILAGLSSIKVIGDIIYQYEPFPDDISLPDNELLDIIALDTEINVKYNTIRNNYLSTSYESIKKSLIGLLILFILISFPVNIFGIDGTHKDDDIIAIKQQQTVLKSEIDQIKSEQITQKLMTNGIEQRINDLDQDIYKMNGSITKK